MKLNQEMNVILPPSELSYKELDKRVEELVEQVNEGNSNPLDLFIVARGYKYIADEIVKKIESRAMDEVLKYAKQDRTINGVKFDHRQGSAIYDYTKDPVYNAIQKELKERELQLKNAIQAAKSGNTIVDEEGVIIEAPPVKSYRKDSITINFK